MYRPLIPNKLNKKCITLVSLYWSSTKLHEYPSSGSRVVPLGRTDGQSDMTKLIFAFRNLANAPKNTRNCERCWFSVCQFCDQHPIELNRIIDQLSALVELCCYSSPRLCRDGHLPQFKRAKTLLLARSEVLTVMLLKIQFVRHFRSIRTDFPINGTSKRLLTPVHKVHLRKLQRSPFLLPPQRCPTSHCFSS
jgi:hypothetical protein